MSETKITKFFSKKTFVNFFSFGLFFVSKNPVNSSWNYFFITIIWISWSDKSGILLTILITAILEPLNQFLKRGRGQSDAHVIRQDLPTSLWLLPLGSKENFAILEALNCLIQQISATFSPGKELSDKNKWLFHWRKIDNIR